MAYNFNNNEIAGLPVRTKPGFHNKIVNDKEFHINFDMVLTGEEQPDDVEIAAMVSAMNSKTN